tara:strand:- start:18939 stop:19307 length:369 start_codon:yes stop_codon:yes gene_type:complete
MNNRLTVLSLYRAKVKICHELGYKYGNLKIKEKYSERRITKNRLIYSRKECGTRLMNKIKETYKSYKNIDVNTEEEKEFANELVDMGFEYLKDLNNIKNAINIKKGKKREGSQNIKSIIEYW